MTTRAFLLSLLLLVPFTAEAGGKRALEAQVRQQMETLRSPLGALALHSPVQLSRHVPGVIIIQEPAGGGGGGTDFTADSACEGVWILYTDGTEAGAEANGCQVGDQDAMAWGGGTFTATTPPAGSASGQDALDFAGANTYEMLLGDGSGEANEFEAADFTVGAWVNADAASFSFIFAKQDSVFQLIALTSARLHGEVNEAVEESATDALPLNEYHHVMMRYDGSGTQADAADDTVEIFIDGVLACSGACTTQTTSPAANTNSVSIGTNEFGSSGFFDGDLMEVFYISRVASDAEAAEFFLCGFRGDADGSARDTAYGGATCDAISTCC